MGYQKQVHEKAWQILEERERASREQTEKCRREIREKTPEIERIEREMAALGARGINIAANGGDDVGDKIEKLGKKSAELQALRLQLLKEAGYPADYLSDRHYCAKCRDKGYVGTEKCTCFNELLRQQAFEHISDFPQAIRPGFGSFDLSFYSQTAEGGGVSPHARMSDILSFCKSYVDGFSSASPSLLMMGRTGLGKTHLSLAIAAGVVERGFGVIYTPVQKLCDRLENGKFSYQQEQKDKYAQELNAVLECDLLLLDDLGTEFPSTFSAAAIGNIINSRLLDSRPTIISTNLDLAGLEKQYSQRVASRLGFSYRVLAFMGEDIRYLLRTKKRP